MAKPARKEQFTVRVTSREKRLLEREARRQEKDAAGLIREYIDRGLIQDSAAERKGL
jgi:hypothetical protein